MLLRLVIPVGKLAIGLFLGDAVPLPHPSGASPWHRTEPGATLLRRAMGLIAKHPAIIGIKG